MATARTKNQAIISYKNYTSAGEVSQLGNTYTDTAKTFTITGPGLILGGIVTASLKNSATAQTCMRFKLVGASLGTIYIDGLANNYATIGFGGATDNNGRLLLHDSSTYTTKYASFFTPITMSAAETITVTIQIRSSTAGSTAYLQSLDTTLYWVQGYIDES